MTVNEALGFGFDVYVLHVYCAYKTWEWWLAMGSENQMRSIYPLFINMLTAQTHNCRSSEPCDSRGVLDPQQFLNSVTKGLQNQGEELLHWSRDIEVMGVREGTKKSWSGRVKILVTWHTPNTAGPGQGAPKISWVIINQWLNLAQEVH